MLTSRCLCRGLLAGKMTANMTFKGDDLRKSPPKFQGGRFQQYPETLGALARQRFNNSVLALAVRWVLDQGPTIGTVGGHAVLSSLIRSARSTVGTSTSATLTPF
jgi:aryl-alcohol dehydrogenase-like predicted oxidoreductase